MKMFEEFMQADYELDQIINKIINRIKYWFQSGSFSMSAVPVDQPTKSSTPNASKRSVIANFADADFYYQLIVRFYIEDLENCDVIIKKYDPAKIDEPNGGQPVWTLELTNDKQVKIDDVKEDFITQKISEMDDKTKENPDENKIEVPKDKQEQAQQPAGAPGAPAPGGMPPPGGMAPMPGAQGMPPAQAAAPFPEAAGAAPPTL
jgi:hypothetical protein